MTTRCCLVLLAMLCAAQGQEERGTPGAREVSLREDLGETYSFCHTQRVRLAQVRKKFPKLEAQAQAAELAWNTAYSQAEGGVTERLKKRLAREWPGLKVEVDKDVETRAAAVTHALDEAGARAFLTEVRQHAKGVMESPQREMLLAADPRFVAAPEQEFLHGHRRQWLCPEGLKAPGRRVSLETPLSWKEKFSTAPGLTRQWAMEGGHSDDTASVVLRRLPGVPEAAEVAEMFTEDFARGLCGEGLTLVSFATSKLGDVPHGIVHGTGHVEQFNTTVDAHVVIHYLVKGDTFFAVSVGTSREGPAEVRQARLKQLEPLMRLVVGSVEFGK